MITDFVPLPKISADASSVIALKENSIFWLNTRTGQSANIDNLPFQVEHMAISPHANYCLISGSQSITYFNLVGSISFSSVFPVSHPIQQLCIGDSGIGIITSAPYRKESLLHILENPSSEIIEVTNSYSLGKVAPRKIFFDEEKSRILIDGRIGSRAFRGFGERYLQLFSLEKQTLNLIWSSKKTELSYNGLLFPLENDNIGLFDRNTISILEIMDNGEFKELHRIQKFKNLEKIVVSPNRQNICWIWSSLDKNNRVQFNLSVASLRTQDILLEHTFYELGQLHTFAISDNSCVTLAYGKSLNELSVCRLCEGVWKNEVYYL